MNFDIGLAAVIVAIGVFYLRLIQLRGRRRQERRDEELARMRAQKKRKASDEPLAPIRERPMIQIASWWLVGAGAVLTLAGLGLRTSPGILPAAEPYWWVIAAVGMLIFTFSLK